MGKIANSKFLTPFWRRENFCGNRCLGRCEQNFKEPPFLQGVSALCTRLPSLLWCAMPVVCATVPTALSLAVCVCGRACLCVCGLCLVMVSWLAIPTLLIRHTQTLHINSLSYPFHSRSLDRMTRSEWVRDSAPLH